MSPAELAAVAAELEPDIRAADNDMREIAALQQRGVTGAGSLSGTHPRCSFTPPHLTYESSIRTLTPTHGRQRSIATTTRGASVATCRGSRARGCPREARRHDRPAVCPAGAFGFTCRPMPTFMHARNLTQVDGLSELFVMWDETLRRAEDRVTKLEKEQEERSRRGYD